jgi:hypothetical protein
MTPDIHDIRGPVPIPYPWLVPLAVALVLLAAVGAAWLASRWWRRRRPPGPPAKTPYQLAVERLIEARALIDPRRAREFGAAVSEAVRWWIEERFGARAPRRTTEEFLHELVAAPGSPLAAHATLLRDFLGHCDLAKFARHPLTAVEMEAMWTSARRFVEDTRPAPEAKAA